MTRLLNKTPLTITRATNSTGYHTESGDYIESTTTTNIPIRCSIQPFRNGDSQIELPDGVRSQDALLVYTQTELLTANERDEQEADTTFIRGYEFECFNVENWTGFGLRTDHYRCVFIRKDFLK